MVKTVKGWWRTGLLAAAMANGLLLSPATQAGDQSWIGELILVPYSFCPKYTREADGRVMDIAENSALYSLLGNQFGGDGLRTFALPDLRGKAPAEKLKYCMVVDGMYPQRY